MNYTHVHSTYSDGAFLGDTLKSIQSGDLAVVDHVIDEQRRELYEQAGRRDKHIFLENGELEDRAIKIDELNDQLDSIELYIGAEFDSQIEGFVRESLRDQQDNLDFGHVSVHYVPRLADQLKSIKADEYLDPGQALRDYVRRGHQLLDEIKQSETDLNVVFAHWDLPEANPVFEDHLDILYRENPRILNRISMMDNVYAEINAKTLERYNADNTEEALEKKDKGEELEKTDWIERVLDSDQEFVIGTDGHRKDEPVQRHELVSDMLSTEEASRAIGLKELAG